MDKDAVTYWRFMNTPDVNANHVWSGHFEGHYMNDMSGMLEVQVSWIDGKPYCRGWPGSECSNTGRVYKAEIDPCAEATPAPTTSTPTQNADVSPPAEPDAWATQVGGSHYRDMKIQPMQYSMANGLDPMQHTIVKYVSRFRSKNGLEDLRKAKQTIDLLIQWEQDNATPNA